VQSEGDAERGGSCHLAHRERRAPVAPTRPPMTPKNDLIPVLLQVSYSRRPRLEHVQHPVNMTPQIVAVQTLSRPQGPGSPPCDACASVRLCQRITGPPR